MEADAMGEMYDRMRRGDLYRADDVDIITASERAQRLCARYNQTDPGTRAQDRLLRELVGVVGEDVVVRPPFWCDYGDRIALGDRTFVNFNCVMLDVAEITVGAACQIASGVQLVTAEHPIDPGPRRAGWESARPIVVGDNVWLCAGVIVCPGVTIGDDSVIGAGSVVTRDIPPGVVAFGSPARVIREIGPADRIGVPEADG